jgi:hypothetical protein
MPHQEWQAKEKTSQYKGVSWHKEGRKWYVKFPQPNGGNKRYGGCFRDELDAAKRVNQFCKELGIPHKNHEISAKPNRQCQGSKHSDNKTIGSEGANLVIDSEIAKTCGTKIQNFTTDDQSVCKQYYFYYDEFLK